MQTPGGGDGRAGKPSFAPSVAGSAPSGAIPDPHQGPTTGGLSMAPMSPIGPGAGDPPLLDLLALLQLPDLFAHSLMPNGLRIHHISEQSVLLLLLMKT